MPKDLDQFVVYKLAALQARFLESSDLLLNDDLESGRAHKETRCGTLYTRKGTVYEKQMIEIVKRMTNRGVVKNSSDVAVLYLIKGIKALDGVVV